MDGVLVAVWFTLARTCNKGIEDLECVMRELIQH
jgi:hypothetical protein